MLALRWGIYPTAKISSSVWLCVTTVTCALQAESRQRPSNSPFLTSQHKTSSLAPTIARPAPVWRAAPRVCSSLAQIALDDAEAMSPNVSECSNFLGENKVSLQINPFPLSRTYKYDFTIVAELMGKFLETPICYR